MRPFDYLAPRTLEEAVEALAAFGEGACVLAGGTDLLLEFRRPKARPRTAVVDISRVRQLAGGIAETDGAVVVRPLATHSTLAASPLLHAHAPLLSLAASLIGSLQIRNRGTVGGNIMNAATCADTVPPLVALGATVSLSSKRGTRQMLLANLFVEPYRTHAAADELLTEIRFPKLLPETESTFIKLGRRNAVSISRLSVAAILNIGRDGRVADARIVPGAAFPTWRRVTEAEEMLVGEKPSQKLFAAAGKKVADIMVAGTGRRWSTEYKEPVIAALVRRALEHCAPAGGNR